MADKDESKPEMVNVVCKVRNGLQLHIMRREGRGDAAQIEDLGVVVLGKVTGAQRESITAVPKELADVWFAENKASSLVTSGQVAIQAPPAPPEKPAKGAAKDDSASADDDKKPSYKSSDR